MNFRIGCGGYHLDFKRFVTIDDMMDMQIRAAQIKELFYSRPLKGGYDKQRITGTSLA